MVRIVPRGYTACADAYLTPKIREYLNGFRAGFCQGLQVSPPLHLLCLAMHLSQLREAFLDNSKNLIKLHI